MLAGSLTLLMVLTAIGCSGQTLVHQPPPVVVRPEKPALHPDRRDQVVARLNEVAWVASAVLAERGPDGKWVTRELRDVVVMPQGLWRLTQKVASEGFSNAKALERAGGWGEKR